MVSLNNVLKGAFYGIHTEALSQNERMTNITVCDNHISEAEYGNLLYYTDFDYIKNNVIYSRSKNATELFGIDMTYCNAEEISGNRIITKSPVTTGQGIYASYFNIDSTRSGLIANNEIIMEGKADGIYTGNSEVRYFHNTVIMYGDNTTSSRAVYCLSATAGMSIHFYNNLFVNLGGGYPMYLTSAALIGNDGDLINLMYPYVKQGRVGTHKYHRHWSVLDQFVVTPSLTMPDAPYRVASPVCIFAAPFMLEKDEKYLGDRPLRTYVGRDYKGGFSDHPVWRACSRFSR